MATPGRRRPGSLALEKELGDKIETSFSKRAGRARMPSAPSERFRPLRPATIIFTTSFGFMDPTIQVAKQFPDVKFEHATGYKRAENVATYNSRFYEGRYVIGVIAGQMSKAGQAGYIASFPIPEVVMGINAFISGAVGQPRLQGQGRLGQHLVRSGQGSRCRQGADRPGRRHHHPAHRLDRPDAGRESAASRPSARPPT
jgi:hypothetical protein